MIQEYNHIVVDNNLTFTRHIFAQLTCNLDNYYLPNLNNLEQTKTGGLKHHGALKVRLNMSNEDCSEGTIEVVKPQMA